MKKRILLTSFDIWLPHQQSNSSDDLLIEVGKLNSLAYNLTFLRQLPVDVQLASSQVKAKIQVVQPNYIILCGMAESRKQLSVEKIASYAENILQTTVDLEQLVAEANTIEISHDCGKFVCEALYYSVLDYLREQQLTIGCIFVHVPVLTQENLEGIFADFLLIVDKLALL
ncbi:peptidase C15 [Scytonema hofmannii FACHB-248]|uniref:Peptidase C15 n=1 Tax=Scytonema hofmannii FACHB-248 TaxID=1842502 RepID=A0ABR8GMN9_9CYAN|nr:MULTISPECIES: peptidase C15 [Nostocales]MBD2604501.1 peptidase C15 [Scytonema hofmannii FACHB-248]